jgi:hypothetical protein
MTLGIHMANRLDLESHLTFMIKRLRIRLIYYFDVPSLMCSIVNAELGLPEHYHTGERISTVDTG